MRSCDAEWQVEPQNGKSRQRQRVGDLHQQLRLAVCARTVREHNGVPTRLRRLVQETSNGGLTLKLNKRDRHGVVYL